MIFLGDVTLIRLRADDAIERFDRLSDLTERYLRAVRRGDGRVTRPRRERTLPELACIIRALPLAMVVWGLILGAIWWAK